MYYRYMDPQLQSFNHQRPPHSHPGHYHPFREAMPPTTIDSHHPSGFGHMPCPNPAEHSGCCNYSYPPGYHTFGPTYSYIPPPPPLYYHTPYAPHPDSYPAYCVPPPHYSLDQPRYDYDKARHHCCGCPNHSCHQKDDRSVRIEEQEPVKEHDRDSSSLIQSPNHNFPVLWVPPEYLKGKENLNGWVPLDINSLRGTKPDGEEKKQSPSPVIWMPSYDKANEAAKDVKEINSTPKSVEEWPSKFKIIPLKFLENGDQDRKPRIVEDETKSGVKAEVPAEKESSRTKNIPVKHLEETNQKKNSTPEKPEGKDEKQVKKASENKSTVKSSKLPPVCLRVDPLPRRKTTNGESRSPSPPNGKSRSPSPPELEGGRAHQQNAGKVSKESREEVAKEKDVPVSGMKGNTASQEAKEQECQASVAASSGAAVVEEACKNDNLQAKQEVVDTSEHPTTEQRAEFIGRKCSEGDREAGDKGQNMEGKKEMRRLSQLDAAVVIQSAYRGYEVRRWQPLEKLRKIAKIREQMLSIRRQIESTEAFTKEKDAKQRVVISETIMNLLLQLDTIQGLHPIVREARKAVARELVCLQEKLDSLDNLVAEVHESVTAKTDVPDENSDDHLSCPETKSTTKQESLEEMVASVGGTGTSERTNVEDLPPDDGGVVYPNSSFVPKSTADQVSKRPTEVDANAEQPPFENEESNRSGDDGVAIIASPSLVTMEMPEEESQIAAERNGSLDQPILNDNEAEYHQETVEGKRAQEAKAEEEKSRIEDGNGSTEQQILDNYEDKSCQEVGGEKRAEEVEAVATKAEESHVAEASMISGSITNMPLKEDGSSNASANEENAGAEDGSVDSGSSDDRTVIHASEELPLQASGEESSISKAALLRVEEANADAEGCLLSAPAEDEIDRKAPKDARAEDEPQALSMAGGDHQTEISAELECVSGLDSVCPEDAVGVDNNVATAVGAEGCLLSAPAEDEIDRKAPKDAHAEDEPQVLSMAGGDHQTEISAELECVSGLDSVCPEDAVGVDNNVATAVGNSGMLEDQQNSVVEQSSPVVADDTAPVLADRGADDDLPVGASAEKKLTEENEKLREMLEKLLVAGKEQLGVISSLNGRVKDLERKLAQKKRVKVRRSRRSS